MRDSYALWHRFPMLQMATKQQLDGAILEADVWSPHGFGRLYTLHIGWHRLSWSANNILACVISPWVFDLADELRICHRALLKHFLCLRIRKATEEDTIIWATVEHLYYWIIVETERPSSNRSCFFRVVRQYVMQSIVNERKSPISRFKIY